MEDIMQEAQEKDNITEQAANKTTLLKHPLEKKMESIKEGDEFILNKVNRTYMVIERLNALDFLMNINNIVKFFICFASQCRIHMDNITDMLNNKIQAKLEKKQMH